MTSRLAGIVSHRWTFVSELISGAVIAAACGGDNGAKKDPGAGATTSGVTETSTTVSATTPTAENPTTQVWLQKQ